MGKRIEAFVLAFVPAVTLLFIQFAAMIVAAICHIFKSITPETAAMMANNPNYTNELISKLDLNELTAPVMLAYLIISFIIAAIIFLAVLKKKPENPAKILSFKSVVAIFILGISCEMLSTPLLSFIFTVFPKMAADYEKLMNMIGLDDISITVMLFVVILGPIVEEMAFRGFTLILFKKSFKKFWIANLCQALLFGVFHGNVPQGIYAFIFGLVLGYLAEKYHSVFASILCHITFNFMGSVIATLVFADESKETLLTIVYFVLGILLLLTGFSFVKKDKMVLKRQAIAASENIAVEESNVVLGAQAQVYVPLSERIEIANVINEDKDNDEAEGREE